MSPAGTVPDQLLNDGHHLPGIGLGTFGLTGAAGITAVRSALDVGYRLIDTAVGYGNEIEVGHALRHSGVDPADVVLTTKIRGRGMGYDEARRSIEASRHRLGVERISLHLIHWPMPWLDQHVATWRALVAARDAGDVRSIGVSNFTSAQLRQITDDTGVVPAVNQIELHPHLIQQDQRAEHRRLGVLTQSWSPLGRLRELLNAPEITRPAARTGATGAQIVLRWHHQLGAVPVPRSSDPGRQQLNLNLAHVELTAEEMVAINRLSRAEGRLWNADPGTTGFM